MVGVRDERWNLVVDRVHGRTSLFDWRRDYDETFDALDREAGSPDVARLRGHLAAFVSTHHRSAPIAPERCTAAPSAALGAAGLSFGFLPTPAW